jgi:hypothetical protein
LPPLLLLHLLELIVVTPVSRMIYVNILSRQIDIK